MSPLDDRRYSISEVSDITDVALHVLRRWEPRFPQLKPKRDRANRRYYTVDDVEIVRRIKQLVHDEKLTTQGAARRLSEEMAGEGRPQTNLEVNELLDKIENEVRTALEIFDNEDEQ